MNKFIVIYKDHFVTETNMKIFDSYKEARAFVDKIIESYDKIYLTQMVLSIVK